MIKSKSENNTGRLIHIRLSEDVHRRLRIRAAELDTSIQKWVSELIEKELSKSKSRS